jgi:hypothetical protein
LLVGAVAGVSLSSHTQSYAGKTALSDRLLVVAWHCSPFSGGV